MIVNFHPIILVFVSMIATVSSFYARNKADEFRDVKKISNIELFLISFAFLSALHTFFICVMYVIETSFATNLNFVLVK